MALIPAQAYRSGTFVIHLQKQSPPKMTQAVHTPWVDLVHRMLTEDEEVFKCPFEECLFRADTVDDVREHCVTECEDRELYQEMRKKHEEKQEDKRKDKARFSRENPKARKAVIELQGPGVMLPEHIVEGIQKISEISPAEFLKMAEERAEDIPQSEIHADLHGLAALIERVSIDEDGCVKDPDAGMPVESISSSVASEGDFARFGLTSPRETNYASQGDSG
ncbi:hypothetical protein FRC11_009518 [Ceratobasidium sp. 423]|nr:hypothetical protein FRC11_009518 [Ceratobasidium sp. 423]